MRAPRLAASLLAVSITLVDSLASAQAPEPAATPEVSIDLGQVRSALLEGAVAALRREKKKSIAQLERAALLAPELVGVQGALGCAALFLDDGARARRVLARLSDLSTYYAMAQARAKGGGISRARTTLVKEASRPDREAEPGALFLAALAFASVGQEQRADELLQRAVKLAPSALDASFAPDPAICVVRQTLRALESTPGSSADRDAFSDRASVELATVLLETGRRGEAVRIAEGMLDRGTVKSAALRILVLVENAIQARRALERVERALRAQPKEEDLLVARVVLLARSGEAARAQRALDDLPVVDAKDLQADLHRVRAELALAGRKDVALALESAEAAVRADPKSNLAVAVYVRALIAAGKLARAESFADALFARKPRELNPFALYAELHAAAKNTQKAEGNRLRARAFDMELAKLDRIVLSREEVLRAVRDAESGVGPAGLEAVRGEYPSLALPLDLSIARFGKAGSARAARDRILTSCSPLFRQFLLRDRSWDAVSVQVALYGKAESLEAPLSAADPGRCGADRPNRKKLRR